MDVRHDTWNVRDLCGASSVTTGAREVAKQKLDLWGAQDVRGERGGDYALFLGD
jgi:hypothetical protein